MRVTELEQHSMLEKSLSVLVSHWLLIYCPWGQLGVGLLDLQTAKLLNRKERDTFPFKVLNTSSLLAHIFIELTFLGKSYGVI